MKLSTFNKLAVSSLLALSLFAFAFPGWSQVRCGTVESEKKRAQSNPLLENTEQFELWMKTKIAQKKSAQIAGVERTDAVTYTIPVVVHVIHNGEAVGVGTNISDAQIASQIDAINRDYPRHNADSVNTPDVPGARFKEVAGKINMVFVLAKQDPEGVPTNGITRTKGTKTSWTMDDNVTFKSLSYWAAEEYLNLWVVNLQDPSGVIGYAQLPESSLGGLSTTAQNRLTDGVAINYQEFGDNSNGGNYILNVHFNTGRTATHEIGHIFGLRHIWGDVSVCTGTDYVDDTPSQDASTSGCPVPVVSGTTIDSTSVKACGHAKMLQNYMDYTDDDCYNLFTKDQIARMVVVLGNSPRRASLLTSVGASDPTLYANDLGARNVINPDISACPGEPIIPTLQVRNYGSNAITSAQIVLNVNGVDTDTENFTLNMAYLDTVNVSFSALTFTAGTSYVLKFTILSTNGGTDGNSSNNTTQITSVAPVIIALPFVEPFNSLPTTWTVVNPDGTSGITWQNVTAPYTSSTNKAMYMDFYDYEAVGQKDRLVTPVFDLSKATVAVLKFDRSYALFSTSNADELMVVVSSTCDSRNTVTVFDKSGSSLATSGTTQTAFVPKSAADWVTETIDLKSFLGMNNVQIAFVAINQNGNNLYLDNVSVTTDNYTDIGITEIKSPSPVTCLDNPVPTINIVNLGSNPITTFTIATVINSSPTTIMETFTGFSLTTGQDQDFQLKAWDLQSGTNTVNLTLSTTTTDVTPSNNVLNLNVVSNASQTQIPLRQNFDASYPDWSLVNPLRQPEWTSVSTNTADRVLSLEYAAFTNSIIKSQSWVASPVLLMSDVSKASLFFDLSYYLATKGTDELQILGSTDCGQSFPLILFDEKSDSLAIYNGVTKKTNTSWSPQQDSDWKRQYVSLDKLAGSGQARIAFVVTNGNGNNLYLDNVEFFTDDNATPLAVAPDYSVYNNFTPDVKVTFNLPEPVTVRIQVVNTLGQSIIDNTFSQVLNQTYTLDLNGKGSGVYIIRMQIGSAFGTAKAVIGN